MVQMVVLVVELVLIILQVVEFQCKNHQILEQVILHQLLLHKEITEVLVLVLLKSWVVVEEQAQLVEMDQELHLEQVAQELQTLILVQQ
jgi:hypothetical protein